MFCRFEFTTYFGNNYTSYDCIHLNLKEVLVFLTELHWGEKLGKKTQQYLTSNYGTNVTGF